MKTMNFLKLSFVCFATLAVTACQKETVQKPLANESTLAYGSSYAATLPKKEVSGNLTVNTTFDADTVYTLNGIVTVSNNATLTIQPGTTIVGTNSVGNPGSLIITKGAKINAVGTSTNPIVFTSYTLVDNNPSTNPTPGDFGGVVLMGDAPTNRSTAVTIEGVSGVSFDNTYGGPSSTNATDNSGQMKYVRIEYAGYIIGVANELNALTCYAVGSGTKLSYIETYYGSDDGFEFFGGTVNASYLLAVGNDDDQFDFDHGYTGTINYGIVVNDPYATHSGSSGSPDSNGMEIDNNSDGSPWAATPKTRPNLNYFSVIGVTRAGLTNSSSIGLGYGIKLRKGTHFQMKNSIVTGYPRALQLEDFAGTDIATKSGNIRNIEVAFNTFQGFDYAIYNKSTLAAVTPVGATNGQGIKVYTATGANDNIRYTQPWFNNIKDFDLALSPFTVAKYQISGVTKYQGAFPNAAAKTAWALNAGWAKL